MTPGERQLAQLCLHLHQLPETVRGMSLHDAAVMLAAIREMDEHGQ